MGDEEKNKLLYFKNEIKDKSEWEEALAIKKEMPKNN